MSRLEGFDRLAFALDRSVRRLDADGRLHVEISNISKATVNGYLGREIPGAQSMGLQPDLIYQVFRPPEELAKASASFNNLPLMDEHIIVSADEPQKDRIVGSTGTDAEFNGEYLRNSLVIWDADMIDRIESGEQKEISCAYRYVVAQEGGTYKGLTYTLKMTNIVGNHVALVPKGRAGPDVVVGDAKTGKAKMKFQPVKAKLAAKFAIDSALTTDDRRYLVMALDAMEAECEDEEVEEEETESKAKDKAKDMKAEDEEAEEEKKAEDKRAKDKAARDKKAKDDEMTEAEKKAAEDKRAKDEAEEKEKAEDKRGMDAAIAKAVTEAETRTVARMNAIASAKLEVLPIVGEITGAMDSAEAVYKFALDHAGVDTKDVPAAAFKAMVKMLPTGEQSRPVIAQDAKSRDNIHSMFPNLRRIAQ